MTTIEKILLGIGIVYFANKLINFITSDFVSVYFYWRKKRNGRELPDLITADAKIRYWDNKRVSVGDIDFRILPNGKIGVYKLIGGSKSYLWTLVGYDDAPPISECTFREFMRIYEPMTHKRSGGFETIFEKQ